VLRVRWAALLGALLALLAPAHAAGVTGTQKVLVVLATWGPQPFSRDEARRVVFQDADAFLRTSSGGQLRLQGEATPWLRVLQEPAGCPGHWWDQAIPRAVADPARAAARAAGFRIADYDRFVYLIPETSCAFHGLGWAPEVLLNGILDSRLVVHELGHTWGLAHAAAASCFPLYCTFDEAGDPYSIMGDGVDDFSVFEKIALGWRLPVTTASRTRTLSLGRADRTGPAAKALRVPVAAGEYWLEYRPKPRGRSSRFEPLAPGVLVRFVNRADAEQPFGPPPVLLLAEGRETRPPLARRETFRAPGVFTARVVSLTGTRAAVRFTWTDRLGPTTPEITEPVSTVTAGSRLAVRWDAAEDQGSGVAHYLVSVDGKAPVKALGRSAVLNATGPGAHRVSVVAVDRAGNRSLAQVRHFQATR
jgi:Gametolysin peptidase M11